MATTAKPIDILAVGLRDTTGAVVASGLCRFYQPSTLVTQTVYSDAACATPYAQPITLNAAGQGTVYCLEPVRMIAKNAADAVTYYDAVVNLQRHDAVYVTDSNINGGAETTLEAVIASLGTSFGAGFQYRESATATARDLVNVIRNIAIQAEDYGVVADGSTDDTTALQNGINRVKALGGGRLLLPTATIKITSALTIDTAGVSIEGNGRGISILKNASTSGNAINVTLGGAADAKLFLKGFSITASTTSSGTGINVSVGNKVVIEDVGVGLHRTGFDCNAVTGTVLRHCFVDSTDDNAAGIGMNLGAATRAERPEVFCGTTNGTGIKASGADARIFDPYVTKFATCIVANGSDCQMSDVNLASATTGVSITAAGGCLMRGVISTCTNGVTVGAVDSVSVAFMLGSGLTNGLTVNASATSFNEFANRLGGTNSFSTATFLGLPWRTNTNLVTSAVITPTFTPNFALGNVQIFYTTYAAGSTTVTIANATGTPAIGDVMLIVIGKIGGGGNTLALSFGTAYKRFDGTTAMGLSNTITDTFYTSLLFQWTGSVWTMLLQHQNQNGTA